MRTIKLFEHPKIRLFEYYRKVPLVAFGILLQTKTLRILRFLGQRRQERAEMMAEQLQLLVLLEEPFPLQLPTQELK